MWLSVFRSTLEMMLRATSLTIALALLIPVSAFAIPELVPVGAPGAPGFPGPLNPTSSIPYAFEIGRFEVTNEEYAEFLSAVAADDPNELWFDRMQSNALGGIERSGLAGDWQYTVKPGMDEMPVNYVSLWDAMRFANWLHNGKPAGPQSALTTEDGAYTMTAAGIANNTIVRNAEALFVIPTRDEWVKAGYYDDSTSTYWPSPANSSSVMTYAVPANDTGNSGNCSSSQSVLYDTGSYALSVSPWGSFDQGGNVAEWTETIASNTLFRHHLGSSFAGGCNGTEPRSAPTFSPAQQISNLGFRIAALTPTSVPALAPAPLVVAIVLLASVGAALAGPRIR